MATATIQFTCTQCGKKYTTPAHFAGKSVSCGCGAKISVPSAQSAVAVPPPTAGSQPQPQQYSAPPQASFQPQVASPVSTVGVSGSMGTASGGSYGGMGGGSDVARRDFPALRFVAKITDIISWLYIIGGMIAAVGVVAAAGPQAFPFSLLGAVALGLIVMLVAVFIRAMAEMIRLALYIAELLEDVRSNTR